MAMLPLLNPFMFPGGPYMAPPAVSYDKPQTYRSDLLNTARADITSEHQLKKIDAANEPGSGSKLVIMNLFRRGLKSITAHIRSHTKATKPWKGKEIAVAEPGVEDAGNDSSSDADSTTEVAESIYNNATENVPAGIDNGNAASGDSDFNDHEQPVQVYYPQFCNFSHADLKKEDVDRLDTWSQNEAGTETADSVSRSDSLGGEATEPTSNSEDQTSEEPDTSNCLSEVSLAEHAGDHDESESLEFGDGETQEVNPIAICRENMMSVNRMFEESIESDESFEGGSHNALSFDERDNELQFNMEIEDETTDLDAYNSHRGLARTKSANLRLRYDILENTPAGQIIYKQKFAGPSPKRGNRYSWDSVISNDTQDSGCGSADDTEITIPIAEDASDEGEKNEGLDSDEDMSEVNLGEILPTLSRNDTGFSKVSSASYETTGALDCDENNTVDDVHLGTIQEEDEDEYQSDEEAQTNVHSIDSEKHLHDYATGLCMIVEEEEDDNENFGVYLDRITAGSNKDFNIFEDIYEVGHGEGDDDEKDMEDDDEEIQYYNGWGVNKSSYEQYLFDSAERGRIITREACQENKEYRLSKCTWWLLSVPDVMGNCGGPLLMVTTPEGENKYPQDVTYYSDDEDEE